MFLVEGIVDPSRMPAEIANVGAPDVGDLPVVRFLMAPESEPPKPPPKFVQDRMRQQKARRKKR